MATAPESDDAALDRLLERNGHDTETATWERSYNKLQCPDCGGLHEPTASECSVCGWAP